jgi:hypothetical protein
MPLTSRLRIALASVALVGLATASATADATLSLQPPSSSALPGSAVSVTVDLANVTDAYAVQFDVTYDPNRVRLTSVVNGGFLPDDNFSAGLSGPGTITFVYDLLTGPVAGRSGGGHLATLTFETVSDCFGSATVQLAHAILIDSKGTDIVLAATSGASIDCLDQTAPVTTASAAPPVNANGWNASAVSVQLQASDAGSGVKEIHYALSGATTAAETAAGDSATVAITAEGVTALTYYAVDNADNAEAPHALTLRVDETAPVLSLPADLVLEATGPGGALATFAASAHDALAGDRPVTLVPPPGLFPLGTTTVSASAVDLAGNTAAGAFRVTVRDTTAPAITSLSASPDTLWPANHKWVPVTITASAQDAVDPLPSLRIVSVSSSEPADGTEADWEITGPLSVNLRAERTGNGAGRVYTITVEARGPLSNYTQPAY